LFVHSQTTGIIAESLVYQLVYYVYIKKILCIVDNSVFVKKEGLTVSKHMQFNFFAQNLSL